MKKLMVGVGLTVLAAPAAQAWTGSMDEMRTMQANESRPIVRVLRHHVATVSCGQCHIRQHRANAPHQQRQVHQATGWQRSARVTPFGMSQRQHATRTPLRQAHPIRPVMMHAYYAPYRQPAAQHPPHVYPIVGPAQPMCRYIR